MHVDRLLFETCKLRSNSKILTRDNLSHRQYFRPLPVTHALSGAQATSGNARSGLPTQGRRSDPTTPRTTAPSLHLAPANQAPASMADTLELDESDLFDTHDNDDIPATLRGASPIATDDALSADHGDEDHPLGLDIEGINDEDCSLSSASISIPLRSPLGSSTGRGPGDLAARIATLGTSTGTASIVGSLPAREDMEDGNSPWGGRSSHQIANTSFGVAASVPVRPSPLAAMGTARRPVTRRHSAAGAGHQHQSRASHVAAQGIPEGEVDNEAFMGYLGTSMPIRIPMLHRRGLAGSPASFEGQTAPFVPPHLLDANADAAMTGRGVEPLNLSPTAAVKREKLMARNAILRSTGFIEVQPFAAPMGEVIDVVKESVMPKSGMPQKRMAGSTSSLTAALGR
jgi:hypothetical protein